MENKKLAFLFIIYDKINHEELWDQFFSSADPERYSIHIHFKSDHPLEQFEQYKLKDCVETEYGEVSVARAGHRLLDSALQERENYKFVFLSQACIPLKSFDYVHRELTGYGESYFNTSPNAQCFPRCDSALKYLSRDQIGKASFWCILNRRHAQLFVDNEEDVVEPFKEVEIADEHCHISYLYRCELQGEIKSLPKAGSTGAMTFVNWDTCYDYPYRSESGLKNYSSISEEELQYLFSEPCLFGRKFNPECSVELSELDLAGKRTEVSLRSYYSSNRLLGEP